MAKISKLRIVTLDKVAVMMAYRDGLALTVPAVRYRIKKSNRAGGNFKLVKVMGPKRRYVDGLPDYQARNLCKLWQTLHL